MRYELISPGQLHLQPINLWIAAQSIVICTTPISSLLRIVFSIILSLIDVLDWCAAFIFWSTLSNCSCVIDVWWPVWPTNLWSSLSLPLKLEGGSACTPSLYRKFWNRTFQRGFVNISAVWFVDPTNWVTSVPSATFLSQNDNLSLCVLCEHATLGSLSWL